MKRTLFLLVVIISSALKAQEGSVGVGTLTPNEKAVLHLVAPNNDQGFLPPKLTTTQRSTFSNQLTSNENGMMVYDSDLNHFFFWLADHWEAVGSSLQAGAGFEIVDGVITNTGDTDPSDDFSGVWGDLTGIPTGFADGIDDVNDADNDPSNELQDLNLSGNTLTITGLSSPTAVDLSPFSGTNTDEQDLQFIAGQITLSGDPDNTIIDLSAYDSDVSDDFSGDWGDLQNVPAAFADNIDNVDDADNNPNNEIELPLSSDADGNTYGDFQTGNYLKALNFLSEPMTADFTNITGDVLDISPFKFARTLLFTPDGKGSTIRFIQVNNGISGQELILVNVGTAFLALEAYATSSNLYLPTSFASINPGGSIHMMYVDDGKGVKGWITLSISYNDAPGMGG